MPSSCRGFCSVCAWYIFDYTTPKLVTIRSFKVGLINRVVQLAVIAYIIGYVIIYQKGYQETGTGQSSVTTKVKGIASTLDRADLPPQYRRIWDVSDYVVPPQENNALFVLTNAIITTGQKQETCPEDPYVGPSAECTVDGNCTKGEPVPNGNGIMTGRCVSTPVNVSIKVCEVDAWCPTEVDFLNESAGPLLRQASNYTILIKNYIEFPKFGKDYKRRNIIEEINNKTYLKSCRYDSENDPYCPVFDVETIVKLAGANFDKIATLGGIISVTISWDCDLDWRLENCKPNYDFNRLDREDARIAPGWNFRFSNQYRYENGSLRRDLFKAYGILFTFSVNGKAGKFSVIPLFLNIGAGLALLGLATIFCDIVLLYILKKRQYYKEKKYLSVVDEEFAKKIRHIESKDDDFENIIEREEDSHSPEPPEGTTGARGRSHILGQC